MRMEFGMSKEAVLRQLRAEAEAAYGAERAKVIGQAIETTAEALWRLSQYPLELTAEMPE